VVVAVVERHVRQSLEFERVDAVGGDVFGERLLASLRAERIDTSHVSVEPEVSTGLAIIPVDDAGENTIMLVAGANGRVSPTDAEAAASAIAGAGALMMQLEVPLAAVARAAEIARERGVRVVLNAAPAYPLPPELLGKIDYLVVNETEAAALSGLDPREPLEAAQALRRAGARNVIVTLGGTGALLAEEGGDALVPGFKVDVVDTTAAGDAFVGAFAVALTEGKTRAEAVRWANAAGALAVTRPGAQPSLPTRQEVESFLIA
jgi:ribokinase